MCVWIFPTQFAKKHLNSQLCLRIQYKMFILSVQKVTSLKPISKTFAICFDKFSPRTVPQNSSLGMLVDFRGKTRDFDITMLEVIFPLVWTHLAYTTASYAFSNASVKTCNKEEHLLPYRTKHVRTLICGNSFKSWNHFTAASLHSLFNSSSQSIPDTQRSCMSTFALVTYSARNPRGSNSGSIFFNKFCFLYWKCLQLAHYSMWIDLPLQFKVIQVFSLMLDKIDFICTLPPQVFSPKLLLNSIAIF